MKILYYCEKCGRPVYEQFGSGRFCSRACANSRVQTNEMNESRSKKLTKTKDLIYGECIICGNKFKRIYNSYGKLTKRKTCSQQCLNKLNAINAIHAGIISANSQQRRSKNEIDFCNLCEAYFKNVKHNEPIFNGWDADVIIEDIKYAILWNGPWHYKKLTREHSLSQVQNRDKIKLDQIRDRGYTPYIIKDMGKENKTFVEEQFNLFLQNIGPLAQRKS